MDFVPGIVTWGCRGTRAHLVCPPSYVSAPNEIASTTWLPSWPLLPIIIIIIIKYHYGQVVLVMLPNLPLFPKLLPAYAFFYYWRDQTPLLITPNYTLIPSTTELFLKTISNNSITEENLGMIWCNGHAWMRIDLRALLIIFLCKINIS